jgi:multiple sugar transport system permease protein
MAASARGRWILTALATFVALIFLSPYVVAVLTSLKPTDELFATPTTLLPARWTFDAFVQMWSTVPLFDYLRNSVVIGLASTAIALLAAAPAAYCTARMRFRGRWLFLGLVLGTQMIVPSTLIIGLYREVVFLRLVDSTLSLIFINAGFNLAFAIWLLHAYFRALPIEVEEAAMIDGCGRLQVLRRIVLPLSLPGLVTATIFTFIAVWNEYIVALTLIRTDENLPVTVGLTSFVGRNVVEYQQLFAASLIAVVPVVVLFAMIERHLAAGLSAGAGR